MLTDDALVAAFRQQTVPRSEWTHETHIRTAFLLLRGRALEEGLGELRAGIRSLNAALGVEEGPTTGYHETVTVAWARLIHAAARTHDGDDSASFCLAHPEFLDKRLLLRHYTRETVMTPEAKIRFVAPDRLALPD